jgi:hypothetical protein
VSWSNVWDWVKALKGTLTLIGVALGVFLIGGAVGSDEHGLFGEITAAWVQGVGTIAAIAAAIWISQSEARRLRLDGEASRRAAVLERVVAVESCARSLEIVQRQLINASGQRVDDASLERVQRACQILTAFIDRAPIIGEVEHMQRFTLYRMREADQSISLAQSGPENTLANQAASAALQDQIEQIRWAIEEWRMGV